MTNNSNVVFETIAKLAGLSVIFDSEFQSKRITVELPNVTIEQALDIVSRGVQGFLEAHGQQCDFRGSGQSDEAERYRRRGRADVLHFEHDAIARPDGNGHASAVGAQPCEGPTNEFTECDRDSRHARQDCSSGKDSAHHRQSETGSPDSRSGAHGQAATGCATWEFCRGRAYAVQFTPRTSLQPDSSSSSSSRSSSSSSTSSTTSSVDQVLLNACTALGTSDYSITFPARPRTRS